MSKLRDSSTIERDINRRSECKPCLFVIPLSNGCRDHVIFIPVLNNLRPAEEDKSQFPLNAHSRPEVMECEIFVSPCLVSCRWSCLFFGLLLIFCLRNRFVSPDGMRGTDCVTPDLKKKQLEIRSASAFTSPYIVFVKYFTPLLSWPLGFLRVGEPDDMTYMSWSHDDPGHELI